ncbi:MAG: flagellar basal body rod protein FlgB [Pseudomonadota bacterium]|jgi:flagellar basal-body rod protein FlgB
MRRSQVISSNIANAETPGYRALGYDFEKQLQDVSQGGDALPVKVSSPKHLQNAFTQADGSIRPDVHVRPTESIPHDGNTVDIDTEMAQFSENQILYRASVESLNRKLGMLRYAISGGR